jgi:hypothetical protein
MPYYWCGAIDGDGHIGYEHSPKQQPIASIYFCGNMAMVSGFKDFIFHRTKKLVRLESHDSIFRVRYRGTRICRSIAQLLYSSCPFALARKLAVAQKMILANDGHKDWSWLTLDKIEQRIADRGTSKAAAEDLGMTPQLFCWMRKNRMAKHEIA